MSMYTAHTQTKFPMRVVHIVLHVSVSQTRKKYVFSY